MFKILESMLFSKNDFISVSSLLSFRFLTFSLSHLTVLFEVKLVSFKDDG
jgi:hypothetical protein